MQKYIRYSYALAVIISLMSSSCVLLSAPFDVFEEDVADAYRRERQAVAAAHRRVEAQKAAQEAADRALAQKIAQAQREQLKEQEAFRKKYAPEIRSAQQSFQSAQSAQSASTAKQATPGAAPSAVTASRAPHAAPATQAPAVTTPTPVPAAQAKPQSTNKKPADVQPAAASSVPPVSSLDTAVVQKTETQKTQTIWQWIQAHPWMTAAGAAAATVALGYIVRCKNNQDGE